MLKPESLEQDPCYLFELLRSDDHNIRIFAISRIPYIIKITDPQLVNKTIKPYLDSLLVQWKPQDEGYSELATTIKNISWN